MMTRLTVGTSYADAAARFSDAALWELFDGDRQSLNIAHECIDRHATDSTRVAVRIAHEDGRDKALTFQSIAQWSSRFAHALANRGIQRGDRVAVVLEPFLLVTSESKAGEIGPLANTEVVVPGASFLSDRGTTDAGTTGLPGAQRPDHYCGVVRVVLAKTL